MDFFEFAIATFGIFLGGFAIFMHYRHKERTSGVISNPTDTKTAERLIALMEKMEKRIATLEKILDAEAPHWREKNNQNGDL